MTILLWPRMNGWLVAWWEPNRSAPCDVAFGPTPAAAVGRLNLTKDDDA